MNSKIKTYVGFAINKGDVIFGLDKILASRKKPKLIMLCKTASEKTTKEVMHYCANKKVKLIECFTPVEDLVSKQGVKIIALTDESLAGAILQNSDEDFKCVEVVN